MHILILSFYYSPDLSAGSFRTHALGRALLEKCPAHAQIEVITTLPNRYSSFSDEAPALEVHPCLTIHRVRLPSHRSGMLDQTRAFLVYARQALAIARKGDYQLVYSTSSRLMTATLGALIARRKKLPLYLDIRDIFVDTINDVLPKKIALLLKPVFGAIERWTFSQATKINLVSRGFETYFRSRYPEKALSYHTNGIDAEFIDAGGNVIEYPRNGRVTVLYAGNIGEGQGLHVILPELAKRLAEHVVFRVIGDGGRKTELLSQLERHGCTNVEILPPIKRSKLIGEYQQADVLFLHLNDYPAFEKVLPSKLFEYGAMGKPVWAGVAGYAASFVREEISNSAVFNPCDVDDAVRVFSTLKLAHVDRKAFVERHSRDNIVRSMAADVLGLLPENKTSGLAGG